jgi:hypothetical protein
MHATRPAAYVTNWERFRRLRTASFALIAALMGNMLAVVLLGSRSLSFFLMFSWVVWVIPLARVVGKLPNWKCPRCGKQFAPAFTANREFATVWSLLTLRVFCVNCGLPKYSIDPNAEHHKAHIRAL